MKYTLLFVFALFLVATSVTMAQTETTTKPASTGTTTDADGSVGGETYGEPIPPHAETMDLGEASRNAQGLVGQQLLLTGKVASYCRGGCWVTLSNGSDAVRVYTKIPDLPKHWTGQTISVFGAFEQFTAGDGSVQYRFNAVSVRG